MKKIILSILIVTMYGCNSESNNSLSGSPPIEYNWVIPKGNVTGNFNLFPLAVNPTFTKVSEVDFISDNALVAIISFKNEIRVYPYKYIKPYESINDIIDGNNIAMTYCPITKSALCWNTNFKLDTFTLRASGYLLNDNVVLYDKNSDTYWSQMLSASIKGKYAEQNNTNFNFIETKWVLVKNHFKDALVFTNNSISNSKKSNNKINSKKIEDNVSVYGILDKKVKSTTKVHIFKYEEFENKIKIFQSRIGIDNILIVGSKNLHFITSYINDQNTIFTPVQNNFPVVMKDSDQNQWNIFGIAISGPRKGQQLKSPTGFIALWWAWNGFYDDFTFNE